MILRWDAPGPYAVGFSTRLGGVSTGPYASLNLGRRTGDDVERVDENRRILCAELGARADRLTLNHQVHGNAVHRARAGANGERGDGLWTTEADLPMLAFAADCLPVALVRTNGTPAAAVVHAGRIGVLGGALAAAARTLGAPLAAAIGPAAGPCCYQVGEEVAGPYRDRYGDTIVQDGKLDLWRAAEDELQRAGVERVHRFDLCTICNPQLFFSHRRDGKPRGVQGVLALVVG